MATGRNYAGCLRTERKETHGHTGQRIAMTCWRSVVLLFMCLGSLLPEGACLNQPGCGVPTELVASDEQVVGKRIVGGTPTTTRQFPWMVMIKRYGNNEVLCGGAILTQRLVLTAAHCLYDLNKNDLFMWAGKDEVDYYSFQQHLYYFSDTVIHDDYDHTTKKNDIAIIRSSVPIIFNSNVRPVCFPSGSHPPMPSIDTDDCLFAGYGDTLATGLERRLNYITVPLVNDSICAQSDWLGNEYDRTRDVSFCGGYADGGPDGCLGDSGGPLVCPMSPNRSYYVYGISSWGKGCGERRKPGVYTRITRFMDWVNTQAERLDY